MRERATGELRIRYVLTERRRQANTELREKPGAEALVDNIAKL
jgi:hypothetical protein